MKAMRFISRVGIVTALLAFCSAVALAQPALVSSISSATSPATAGGNSLNPIISRDGRYVLYSSDANNLVTNTNGAAFPPVNPAQLNVFLYDRTNGTTTLVSVNTNGTGGGNGASFAIAISTNGQFALFESAATNLVPGDSNSVNDVFVRDVINGITTLVSVSTNGGVGNGVSRSSTMTPDGRYVAFVSAANNLVAGDTNQLADVFVRDLQASNTVLASVGAEYSNAYTMVSGISTNSSEAPDISDDGRYVAFSSTATNLVPGVATTCEIYVRDLLAGITLLASTNSRSIVQAAYNTTNVVSCDHMLSGDGQYVAYVACAENLNGWLPYGVLIRYHVLDGTTDIVSTNVEGTSPGFAVLDRTLDMTPDGNYIAFITNTSAAPALALWVWNAQSNLTTLVSGGSNNPTGPDYYWPQLSADGRYVAFFSSVTNLATNTGITGFHLYVYDSLASNFTLVDPRTNGSAPAYSPPDPPSLSTNGQFIAFDSYDSGLVTNDSNRGFDVFVGDLSANTIQLISAVSPSLPSLTPNGASLLSAFSLSSNAQYIAFTSTAENLVTNDTNLCRDVFVYNILTGSNTLVSIATNGFSGNNISSDCAISGNGRYVAFTSSSTNLVAVTSNTMRNVFLRDLQAGITTLISVNTNGTAPGNADSYSPIISADGRYVLFHSKATNIAAGFPYTGGEESLFRRDTQLGTTFALVTNQDVDTSLVVAASPDDRFVVFYGGPGLGGPMTYVWDLQTTNRIYTNSANPTALAISTNGTFLAYSTSAQVFLVNIVAKTNLLLGTTALTSHPSLQFSGSGRYLVFGSGGSGHTNQIMLFDSQAGVTNLISKSYNSSGGGNGPSDSAVISPNGQFIAYRSTASNLVPGCSNGLPNIFLFDQSTGITTLLTSSAYGNFAANGRSLIPVFSADSQTLVLTSQASDLVPQDFNQAGDLFAFSLDTSNSQPSLAITIIPPTTVTWPAVAGQSYQVQFKNNLTDPAWQIVNGNVTIAGSQAYITDLAPAPIQRFYRVLAY